MERLNLTGYGLHKHFGLSKGAVTNWRKGKCSPRLSFLDKYCSEYGVNKNWIFTGEGDMFAGDLSGGDRDFIRKIDLIKKETGITNKEIANKLHSYSTVISELKAGKTKVRPEWVEIIEKEYGFIWNDLEARKEIIKLRQDIEKIKAALLLINIEI